MKAPITTKQSAVENVSKEKLIGDLRMVVADAQASAVERIKVAGSNQPDENKKACSSIGIGLF